MTSIPPSSGGNGKSACAVGPRGACRDEQAGPEWADLDLGRLAAYTGPALITKGTESPPWFATITARLAGALHRARTHTFDGAGHIPRVTHPEDYVDQVTSFIASTRRPS